MMQAFSPTIGLAGAFERARHLAISAYLMRAVKISQPRAVKGRYRWTETGALDHYRYAHAFDHLYGAFRLSCGVAVDFV